MNLGADVAAAATPVTAVNTAETIDSGGFSGILQSVMQKGGGESSLNNLTPEQILANQMLMSQLQNQDMGSEQGQLPITNPFLPDGNSLPDKDVELAWQGIFGEYDSSKPEDTYLFSAEGDNESYVINDLLAENAKTRASVDEQGDDLHESILSQKGNELLSLQSQQQEHADKSALASTLNSEHQSATNANASHINSREKGGLSALSLDPASDAQSNKQAKLDLQSNAEFSQQHNSRHEAQVTNQSSTKQESNNYSDLTKVHNGLNQSDINEQSNLKLEANSSQLNVQDTSSRANPSNITNATTAYSAISGLTPASSTSTQHNGNVIAQLTVPPNNPDWSGIVGDRVQWMANQNIQQAQIRLNPPELGMLEVRINIGQDQQTHISFSSPHSQVRDALESSVPRLREMFGDNGLTLGDVDVSQHSMAEQQQSQQDADEHSSSNKSLINQSTDNTGDIELSSMRVPQQLGMLDTYA